MPKVVAVQIVGLGPVAVATTLWRSLGILRATAVVKSTFAFVPGAAMTVAEAMPLVGTEVHHAGNPMRSIRASSELSPLLKKADVLFVGQAYPPGGVPSPRSTVRLAVVRNGWALIDKTLTVLGDRTVGEPEPTPFQQMPILYERAQGGIGSVENPLGTGLDSAQGSSLPNFGHPAEGRTDPAGFGPISWSWPARRRRLRGYPRKHLGEPIAKIPDDFDLEFFQAAPPDQRTTYLRGDEHLVLEGLHPSHPRLEMALPGVRGAARVYTPDGIEINLTLHADTLFIDGDAEQCSITWRGSFPVSSEEAIEGLRILAGVESAGKPIAWPTPARLPAVRPPPSPSPSPAPPPEWEGTYALSDAGNAGAGALIAPFAIAEPGASPPSAHPPIPGAPWAARESSPRAAKQNDFAGAQGISYERATRILSPESPPNAAPFGKEATADSNQASSTENRWEVTHAVSNADQKASYSAPFQIAAPGAARGGSSAPIPGAPWAPAQAQRPPLPKPRASMPTMAMIDSEAMGAADDDDVKTSAHSVPSREPPPAPPSAASAPPVAPVAPVAPLEPGNAWSWVSVAPAPSSIENAPEPRAAPPKPVLSKKLYGGFGAKKT